MAFPVETPGQPSFPPTDIDPYVAAVHKTWFVNVLRHPLREVSPQTDRHCDTAAEVCMEVLDLSGEYDPPTKYGAAMGFSTHDIGKRVPAIARLVDSAAELEEDERRVVQSHPFMGFQMLQKLGAALADGTRHSSYNCFWLEEELGLTQEEAHWAGILAAGTILEHHIEYPDQAVRAHYAELGAVPSLHDSTANKVIAAANVGDALDSLMGEREYHRVKTPVPDLTPGLVAEIVHEQHKSAWELLGLSTAEVEKLAIHHAQRLRRQGVRLNLVPTSVPEERENLLVAA